MGSSKKHYDGIKSNVIMQKFLKIKRNTNIYLRSLRHSFQSVEDGNKWPWTYPFRKGEFRALKTDETVACIRDPEGNLKKNEINWHSLYG